jgi:cathepsin L
VQEYNKQYSPREYAQRKEIFEARLDSIRKHNQDNSKTWKRGVNHMSDWTAEEFQKLLGYKKHLAYASKAKRLVEEPIDISLENLPLPAHVDWREKKVVTAVKDQGQCGSCWSFGTAETVESHFALAKGELLDLSEQQILDCTPNPNQCGGTGGCGGGTAELAYAQIMQMGGLSSEWTYPYVSYFGQNSQCHFNASNTRPIAQLSGFVGLPSNQYAPLLQAVATKGPVAISVDASAWSDYESGVFNGCNQTTPDIDHAVQLVGYGTDAALGDYWLVRNSWSPLWGEVGYIRLYRTSQVQCGIDVTPSDGTGCSNGPSQVVVCGTCGILYDNTFPLIAK